jgi:hypothetical protein
VIGALAMLLKELGTENQISYGNDMRMSTAKFEELLQMIGLKTQRQYLHETAADTTILSQWG